MLLCGQMVLHVVFCFGQAPAGPAMAGHHGMAVQVMPGPGMFAVHLAAAFLLGWVLHRGEHALWRIVRASRRTAGALVGLFAAVFLRSAAHCPPDVRVLVRRRFEDEAGRGETPLLDHAVIRRGPPGVALA
jgi:hypothetical protein